MARRRAGLGAPSTPSLPPSPRPTHVWWSQTTSGTSPGSRFSTPCGLQGDRFLLPLNRPGRLRRDVVGDPVDALHLVDDAGGDPAEEAHVEGVEIRRHAVDGGDGAQRADMVVSAR